MSYISFQDFSLFALLNNQKKHGIALACIDYSCCFVHLREAKTLSSQKGLIKRGFLRWNPNFLTNSLAVRFFLRAYIKKEEKPVDNCVNFLLRC